MERQGRIEWLSCWLCGALLACGGGGRPSSASPAQEPAADDQRPAQFATDTTSSPPPASEALSVVKNFRCLGDRMTDEMQLIEIANRPGERVLLRKSEQTCRFELIYASRDGDSVLSSTPSGYLLTVADVRDAGGVLCASNILHSEPTDGAAAQDAHGHFIDGVTIECSMRRGRSWPKLQTVVPTDGTWAAWVSAVRLEDDGSAVLSYRRDFAFQFLQIGDQGRPAVDGLYELRLTPGTDRIELGETRKTSDRQFDEASMTVERWDGT
jgi:hypothetical protein